MGGALTNLAAVAHGLAEYDPDVVHGTRLDRGRDRPADRAVPHAHRRRAARDRRPPAQPRRGHPRGRLRRARGADEARLRLARRERPRPAPLADRRSLRPRPAGRLSASRDPRRAGPRRRGGCSPWTRSSPRRSRTPSLASTARHAGLHAREAQPHAGALGEVEDLRERRRALGVDEVHALHVQEHRAQRRVGILRERHGCARRAPRRSRRTGRRPVAAWRSPGTSRRPDARARRGRRGFPARGRAAASPAWSRRRRARRARARCR